MTCREAAGVVVALLSPLVLLAQTPTLSAAPPHPEPGTMVRLTLTAPARGGDRVRSIHGSMAGEPLHFIAAAGDTWHAIGAMPVDADKDVVTRVIVQRESGKSDTLATTEALPPAAPPSAGEPLAVEPQFTQPLSAATQARIARENARAQAVGRRAHTSPPRWTESFLEPRPSAITSPFGTGRTFNGVVTSRHLGVDFRAAVGDPVRASNRGVVALVDTFFLAGRVVYIDHGGGVVTGYFHLSKPLVKVGETVERGQVIGLAGATGRVTGPHVHWAARYGALTFNPLDLLPLDPRWYGGAARR